MESVNAESGTFFSDVIALSLLLPPHDTITIMVAKIKTNTKATFDFIKLSFSNEIWRRKNPATWLPREPATS